MGRQQTSLQNHLIKQYKWNDNEKTILSGRVKSGWCRLTESCLLLIGLPSQVKTWYMIQSGIHIVPGSHKGTALAIISSYPSLKSLLYC